MSEQSTADTSYTLSVYIYIGWITGNTLDMIWSYKKSNVEKERESFDFVKYTLYFSGTCAAFKDRLG